MMVLFCLGSRLSFRCIYRTKKLDQIFWSNYLVMERKLSIGLEGGDITVPEEPQDTAQALPECVGRFVVVVVVLRAKKGGPSASIARWLLPIY